MPATQGELAELTVPPTEAEIGNVIDLLSVAPEVKMIVRRLAFQRDRMKPSAKSYESLAARTGADPVSLAEADVLGRLYDACDGAAGLLPNPCDDTIPSSSYAKSKAIKVAEALAACRKQEQT